MGSQGVTHTHTHFIWTTKPYSYSWAAPLLEFFILTMCEQANELSWAWVWVNQSWVVPTSACRQLRHLRPALKNTGGKCYSKFTVFMKSVGCPRLGRHTMLAWQKHTERLDFQGSRKCFMVMIADKEADIWKVYFWRDWHVYRRGQQESRVT